MRLWPYCVHAWKMCMSIFIAGSVQPLNSVIKLSVYLKCALQIGRIFSVTRIYVHVRRDVRESLGCDSVQLLFRRMPALLQLTFVWDNSENGLCLAILLKRGQRVYQCTCCTRHTMPRCMKVH